MTYYVTFVCGYHFISDTYLVPGTREWCYSHHSYEIVAECFEVKREPAHS
jgi:hypothetical protein